MAKNTLRRNHLQEQQRAHTRGVITQAALKVFSEQGYVASSIEHVLLSAGVSRATFYNHFDGKLAIVSAIAEDFEPVWHPVFQYLCDLKNPGLPELVGWAFRHLELHRSHADTCTLLTQVTVLEETLYWQISRQRDALIEMLARYHPAFQVALANADAMLEAQVLLWQVDQTCFHIARQHIADPGNAAALVIARPMLAFLRGHAGMALSE